MMHHTSFVGGLPPGAPRNYRAAAALGFIEPRVAALVAALNVPDLCSTHASCEGHRHGPAFRLPYVAFRAAETFAGAVAQALYADALRDHRLRMTWDLTGHFDTRGALVYRLAPLPRLRAFGVATYCARDMAVLPSFIHRITPRFR